MESAELSNSIGILAHEPLELGAAERPFAKW
jgi:hypothetical protein